ncbi:heat-stable enterotoxin receptor-like isoform X2 [Scleropages formosus]|uniref:heat-stable enterotoxin receptor-like isoform X2 n=1 Tax=Scleropages formosus TaxID=113540 RepID=UPI000878A3A5|nr:heat-stable enterotoxin receptor-like isoform X2 [Scleropages formosus]
MARAHWHCCWLFAFPPLVAALAVHDLLMNDCLRSEFILNVVSLEDEPSQGSRIYVKKAVQRAIEKDRELNAAEGINFTLTANYRWFNTTLYRNRGCGSSVCEGVGILKQLNKENQLGCAMLGPSCTYATFQMVDVDVGPILTIPIISPGSFGLSCDYQVNLTRLLPPARKISNFFVHFWNFTHTNLKPEWGTAYVYRKPESTEDCFWYTNALEFASINGELLRNKGELHNALSDDGRKSNLFILCGSQEDFVNLTAGVVLKKEVVFILIDLYNQTYHHNTSVNETMKNVLVLTLPNLRNYSYYSNFPTAEEMESFTDHIIAYHDGVLLFGHVVREMARGAHDILDVEAMNASAFRNISFDGMGGHYVLDEYGDRDLNLSVMYWSTNNSQYKVVFEFDTATNVTKVVNLNPCFLWTGTGLPSDIPKQRKVILKDQDIIVIILALSVLVVTAIALIFYRQNIKERQIQKRWSHIHPSLIFPLNGKERGLISLKIDEDHRKDSTDRIRRARYDKKTVILKELYHTDGYFSEMQRIELNALLRIDYYNLTKFYGTVKFEHGVFGVFEFCERGSLTYVLKDKISYPDETFMDFEFKISVMNDIAKGMSYLHSSNISVHGRLKSTNCVVDNRMVVKITDFGCNTILVPGKDLWTAPEHLRKRGISQKGDVYSYGIIGHEIVLRKAPFYTEACSDTAEKLYKVEYPPSTSFFRPDLNMETAGEKEQELYGLIRSCWDEDPERRPDFKKIESSLGKIISNLHDHANKSYMDNLIRRLQMYSRNLEHLVEERTALYKAERDRANRLNFMLLPAPVVRSLKETGQVEPELFEEVTIYFSDIVGFTTLCRYSTPMEVVDMLNDIYGNFDRILDHHDVYKVETIGDAYMVASGLPRRNGNRHAVDICCMALDILAFLNSFQLRHLPGLPVWIRIGVHSGPCAAGVVGVKMPRYCLFGDTVNTASRMESTGFPLRIHVSQPTVNILQRTDCKFEYERRGETYLKGKGTEMTYWLTGITKHEYNLPTPPTAENFQQLQEDLADMIVSSLEKRALGAVGTKKRKMPSIRQRKKDDSQVNYQPEYLHLPTLNDLSTHL